MLGNPDVLIVFAEVIGGDSLRFAETEEGSGRVSVGTVCGTERWSTLLFGRVFLARLEVGKADNKASRCSHADGLGVLDSQSLKFLRERAGQVGVGLLNERGW